jgi:D-alanyl-lipoteichoic acid acyltransferase DltB (MBOAT superfamily)
MIPFSSSDFFLVMAIFIALLALVKKLAPEKTYRECLFVLNATFLLVFYPDPLLYFSFIVYSYAITWLFGKKLHLPLKIYGILALLLPMLLVKFNIRFSAYPFELNYILSFAGLSYASFRTMSYFMDKDPKADMVDPVSYFNYLSFTPTLLIGPIDRFAHFKASQDKGFSSITTDNFIAGWNDLIKGYRLQVYYCGGH